jgi:hypothetical protein
MEAVVVNVGHRDYVYKHSHTLNQTQHYLQHYINNVSKQYEGEEVESNIRLARDIIAGKKIDIKKYGKFIAIATAVVAAFVAFGVDPISAASLHDVPVTGHIDLSPLDRFFKEVYFNMLKGLMYILTPVYAYIGYVLVGAGSNAGKRTQAKSIAVWSTIAAGVVAGAPWLAKMVYQLWVHIVF